LGYAIVGEEAALLIGIHSARILPVYLPGSGLIHSIPLLTIPSIASRIIPCHLDELAVNYV